MNITNRTADRHGKPYYSLDAYLKNTYGEKLYKIAIDAGFTCPNRDGTLGYGGCLFCSAGGSGDYAVKTAEHISVREQLAAGRALFHHKRTGLRYIAYFQAYTNTYGPLPHLYNLYKEALQEPTVAGISIATRPDCMSAGIVTMLTDLLAEFPGKFIWIELGLQTIHEKTADLIRRGYPLSVYDDCVSMLSQAHIPVVTHIILGLPGEIKEHMLSTIDHLNRCGTWGVKLQLLHVLQGTDLAALYTQGRYQPLSQDDYTDLVIDCLEHLSPDIVVHRLTGDGPRDLLLAPRWSLDKRGVLNTLHHAMKLRETYQGRLYNYSL
ncbi:MAG: TIGR01212 family radical SAM protein [Lachnospiraceae bacterium]|nr:TIGR01212 family radical SAM protein [Lachnospiraceae bacterium]